MAGAVVELSILPVASDRQTLEIKRPLDTALRRVHVLSRCGYAKWLIPESAMEEHRTRITRFLDGVGQPFMFS